MTDTAMINDQQPAIPQVWFFRGETPEECMDHANSSLRYSLTDGIFSTELTADEDGYILIVSVLTSEY